MAESENSVQRACEGRDSQFEQIVGNSPGLEALVGAAQFQSFPTAAKNLQVQFRQNAEWWQKNGADVNKIWSQFLLNA